MPPILSLLRPHHWVKNLLVFVPALLTLEQLTLIDMWAVLQVFVALSLAASAGYAVNDVLDRNKDRLHPRKRLRPLALGSLTKHTALSVAVVCALLAIGIAWHVSLPSAYAIFGYLALTLIYSVLLKPLLFLDVLGLGALYALRVVAGAVALGLMASVWLLGFVFVFMSALAILKRFNELREAEPGRDSYRKLDPSMLLGIAAGGMIASAMMLTVYLPGGGYSNKVDHPLWLYGLPLLVFLWSIRITYRSKSGRVHADPVVFALSDQFSWICLLLAVGCLVLAQWQW